MDEAAEGGNQPGLSIAAAQREMRDRFVGGFYGQLVSGLLWLGSATLATWATPRAAITALVVGGFFIFPVTELLIRAVARKPPLRAANQLKQLGMQVAFVLPMSMPLLVPVSLYRLNWFYPAMMILLGAHYVPFVFLYGMPQFAALAGLLLAGGMMIALYLSDSFALGAWYTAALLLAFAYAGKQVAGNETD